MAKQITTYLPLGFSARVVDMVVGALSTTNSPLNTLHAFMNLQSKAGEVAKAMLGHVEHSRPKDVLRAQSAYAAASIAFVFQAARATLTPENLELCVDALKRNVEASMFASRGYVAASQEPHAAFEAAFCRATNALSTAHGGIRCTNQGRYSPYEGALVVCSHALNLLSYDVANPGYTAIQEAVDARCHQIECFVAQLCGVPSPVREGVAALAQPALH